METALQTVLRIQDCRGLGPYIGSMEIAKWYGKLEKTLDYHNSSKSHPSPRNDEGLKRYPKSDEICGFISMDQLLQWFSGDELKTMEDYGFIITPMLGAVTAIGEKQVLFMSANFFQEKA